MGTSDTQRAEDVDPPAREDQQRLRLLLVVPFAPRRDTVHGGRVVGQLLSRLAAGHDVAVVYLRAPGEQPIEPEVADQCGLVVDIERREGDWPGREWKHRWHVLGGALSGMPTQARAIDRRFVRAVRDAVARWRPDIVQFEHNEVGHVAAAIDDPAVRRVLVCHEPGLLAARDQAARTRGRQRLAHRIEMLSWRRYWRRGLGRFDAIVCFTERDRDVMAGFADPQRLVIVPLAVDVREQPLDPLGHGAQGVCLIGNFAHPPNADAAMRLMGSIMPAVRRRHPGRELQLVGAVPTRQMLAAAGPQDIVTGFVESVTPYEDAAALLALPIRMGGGMRVKLMEALAAGKAVVASPLAAAGLEVADGQQLLLADSDEEFTTAIIGLLDDPAARERLATSGRVWAVANLSWDSRVVRYEELYRSLLRQPVGAGRRAAA